MGRNTQMGILFENKDKVVSLTVYVDDFHMAGKKASLKPMWRKLTSKVDLEEPTAIIDHIYLGCTPHKSETNRIIVTGKSGLLKHNWFHPVPAQHDYEVQQWHQAQRDIMELRQCKFVHTKCFERFCERANKTAEKVQKVSTPFLDDHRTKKKNLNQWENSLTSARTSRKKALVPSSQWATGHFIDRELFNKTCDEIEQRMRQAITKTNQLQSPCRNLQTILSFWKQSKRMQILPVSRSWTCKKQIAVSHSSIEAEVISLDAGVRMDVDLCIESMGHSSWRVRTTSSGRPAAMSQTKQTQGTGWTRRFRSCDTERTHYQHASVSWCFGEQRSCDQHVSHRFGGGEEGHYLTRKPQTSLRREVTTPLLLPSSSFHFFRKSLSRVLRALLSKERFVKTTDVHLIWVLQHLRPRRCGVYHVNSRAQLFDKCSCINAARMIVTMWKIIIGHVLFKTVFAQWFLNWICFLSGVWVCTQTNHCDEDCGSMLFCADVHAFDFSALWEWWEVADSEDCKFIWEAKQFSTHFVDSEKLCSSWIVTLACPRSCCCRWTVNIFYRVGISFWLKHQHELLSFMRCLFFFPPFFASHISGQSNSM